MSTTSTPSATRTVLLVEDQTAIRQMLATIIAAMPGFKVVAQASGVAEALKLAEQHQPTVVVLDWMLVGETGRVFLETIKSWPRRPHVLVFSANTTKLAVHETFSLGASGYIEKTASFADFTNALETVAAGRPYLGPTISEVISNLVRAPSSESSLISPREREILRYVAEGLSSKMIADRLGISIRTVNSHRAALIRKTGLHSVAELTRYACEQGLVAPSAQIR